jgi:hypothetical protein
MVVMQKCESGKILEIKMSHLYTLKYKEEDLMSA